MMRIMLRFQHLQGSITTLPYISPNGWRSRRRIASNLCTNVHCFAWPQVRRVRRLVLPYGTPSNVVQRGDEGLNLRSYLTHQS